MPWTRKCAIICLSIRVTKFKREVNMEVDILSRGTTYNVSRSDNVSVNTNIDKKVTNTQIEESQKIEEPEELENQVAVSQDGDTLQITPEAIELSETSSEEDDVATEVEDPKDLEQIKINKKREKLKEQAKLAKKKEKLKELSEEINKAPEDISKDNKIKKQVDFTGKSDSEVTRMYIKGEISRAEYDTVIQKRESMREKLLEANKTFVNTVSEGDSTSKSLERFESELKSVLKESTSGTDAKAKLDMIEKLEKLQEKQDSKEKAPLQKEIKVSYR